MLRRISLLFLLLFSLSSWADVTYETWDCPWHPCPQGVPVGYSVLSSGTLTGELNYDWFIWGVLDSGRWDYVVVKLTGSFVMPGTAAQNYTVTFLNQDDDGSITKIGNTIVINDWHGIHGPSNRTGSIVLVGGQTYTYERWYSEWNGGAVMRQYWYIPGVHNGYVIMNAGTDFTSIAPVYSSGITNAQQTRKTSETAQRNYQSGNVIQIEQIGNNNTFTIRQGADISGKNRIELYSNGDSNTYNLNQGYTTGGTANAGDSNNHYLNLHVTGNSNNITKQQTGTSSFNETTVSGNTNNLTNIQQGNSAKTLFQNISGNSNTVNTNQKDTGQHFLDLNLTGNGHSVTTVQEGAGSHAATINFTNSGGASSLNLNQSGANNQTYSIQQSCTNPAGCSTTITQP